MKTRECQQRSRRCKKNKTLNENFITENYNNQNLKLNVWVQWQNGGTEERISALEDRIIEIMKAEERGNILKNTLMWPKGHLH